LVKIICAVLDEMVSMITRTQLPHDRRIMSMQKVLLTCSEDEMKRFTSRLPSNCLALFKIKIVNVLPDVVELNIMNSLNQVT